MSHDKNIFNPLKEGFINFNSYFKYIKIIGQGKFGKVVLALEKLSN
jgi:hypothetical protein